MEENALLANIASIIIKDILVDECDSYRRAHHFLWHNDALNGTNCAMNFSLLHQVDDDDLNYFIRQHNHKNEHPLNKGPVKKAAKHFAPKTGGKEEPKTKRPRGHSQLSANIVCKDLNLLNEFDHDEFEDYLHMSKMSFLKMFQYMRHLLMRSAANFCVPPQSVFSLSLWKLTTDEHFERIAHRFEIEVETCQTIIRQFWHLISDHYENFIKWPNSQQSQQRTLQGFQRHRDFKNFPMLFGIVAIKRLDIFLASEDSEVPIILQIICNVDQKVIDCFVELEQDYCFNDTPMGQMLALNQNTMPRGSYLIGDKCFPLKPYLIRPYVAPCFRKEQEFNRIMSSALLLAQQTLDSMAKRFNSLYALEARNLAEVRKIIETICALHNLSITIEDDYVERKREVCKFNWASNNNVTYVVNSEHNTLGAQRRSELVESIIC